MVYGYTKKIHVKFLGYAHSFMSIRISKLNNYSISVDQARCATAVVSKYIGTVVVSKYLGTATVTENFKFHKTNLTHDI